MFIKALQQKWSTTVMPLKLTTTNIRNNQLKNLHDFFISLFQQIFVLFSLKLPHNKKKTHTLFKIKNTFKN